MYIYTLTKHVHIDAVCALTCILGMHISHAHTYLATIGHTQLNSTQTVPCQAEHWQSIFSYGRD